MLMSNDEKVGGRQLAVGSSWLQVAGFRLLVKGIRINLLRPNYRQLVTGNRELTLFL